MNLAIGGGTNELPRMSPQRQNPVSRAAPSSGPGLQPQNKTSKWSVALVRQALF